MKYVIYKYDGIAESYQESDLQFRVWSPGISNAVPSGLSKKYILYYFFHLTRLFKNNGYAAVQGFMGDTMVCSLLIVPKYYKWPFMPSADVQLAYVKTNKEYRGQGLGGRMLKFTLAHLQAKGKGTGIWYVTDTDNPASMALAEKSGFKFFSYGKKGHLLGLNFLPTLEQE